jgi:hypothetical protein
VVLPAGGRQAAPLQLHLVRAEGGPAGRERREASLAGYMVNANAIDKAKLTGKFGRKK